MSILSVRNAHERDANIRFYAMGHKYEILTDKKSKYTSVTTWNHSHFAKFDADAIIRNIMSGKNWNETNKYWGMTAEEIKASWKTNGDKASTSGTNLHERIEEFMNCGYNEPLENGYTNAQLLEQYNEKLYSYSLVPETTSDEEEEEKKEEKEDDEEDDEEKYEEKEECKEWNYFLNFVRDNPSLKPYRTEWMIYDEDIKIAGSIDMVFENPDGTLSIYDWKRCKEITEINTWKKYATNPIISHVADTNYWHYALQLNTYKAILERKYGKEIVRLCLVRLHPDAYEYELIALPVMTEEIVGLYEERMNK